MALSVVKQAFPKPDYVRALTTLARRGSQGFTSIVPELPVTKKESVYLESVTAQRRLFSSSSDASKSSLSGVYIAANPPKDDIPQGFSSKHRMPYLGYMEIGPNGQRKVTATVVPTQHILKDPMAGHYGQQIFEGIIATFDKDAGIIRVFGLDQHCDRFNNSLEQLSMPQVNKEEFKELVIQTLLANAKEFGNAPRIYIRPVAEMNYNQLGNARDAQNENMVVTVSTIPIGDSYYKSAQKNKVFLVNSTRVNTGVEDPVLGQFRSSGKAKQGGNYAGPMDMKAKAIQAGGIDAMYIDVEFKQQTMVQGSARVTMPIAEFSLGEATSSAPIIFRRDGVVHSVLGESSLPSVTQSALGKLAAISGYPVEKGPFKLDSLQLGQAEGLGLCGTAAGVVAIDEMVVFGRDSITFSNNAPLIELGKKLGDIKTGKEPDSLGMVTEVRVPKALTSTKGAEDLWKFL